MRRHKKDETKLTIEFIYKNNDEKMIKAIKDFFIILHSSECESEYKQPESGKSA